MENRRTRKLIAAPRPLLLFQRRNWCKVDVEGKGIGSVVNRWKRVEVREIAPRVTQGWWVYGGLRPSGPPAPVQTETAGTALSWQGPRPPRFRYHRQNGWRAPPTSWGSLASPSLVPWSIPPWTRESVSFIFSFLFRPAFLPIIPPFLPFFSLTPLPSPLEKL